MAAAARARAQRGQAAHDPVPALEPTHLTIRTLSGLPSRGAFQSGPGHALGARRRTPARQGRASVRGDCEPAGVGEPANKGRRYPAEILSAEEVGSLLRAASPRAPTGLRARALIALLYRGGLRVFEALALHPKDVDERSGTVTVLAGKGGRRRVVGLDPAAFVLVERWADAGRAAAISARRPLLCTLGGEPLDPSYVRRLLPRLARRAGIQKRVHAHGLRHAAELAVEGKPVNLIQRQLGHSSLATASRYLDHIAPRDLIAAMRGGSGRPPPPDALRQPKRRR
ncbi:MAG: tyrosine-type recombinase/integrase [Solirubrobacterales bacterium]|nr:tyrosine-type recombinase/integrase [Solirubrobacterales bacterium]